MYLGTAMQKPIALDNGAGVVIGGSQVIENSIIDILNTPVNTRLFNPAYGSRLHEMLFEPNDDIVEAMVATFIFEAIRDNEGRAGFKDVTFTADGEAINCQIFYTELPSNEIKSFVYPYYRKLTS